MNGKIEKNVCRNDGIGDILMNIWEESVRATHKFLQEKDIQKLKPLVLCGFRQVQSLYCFKGENGVIAGFMGISSDKVEMLFIHPDYRGMGIGGRLISFAIQKLNVRFVDVNEQNPGAKGFYEHYGFKSVRRSELDAQGNPFPILHMQRTENSFSASAPL